MTYLDDLANTKSNERINYDDIARMYQEEAGERTEKSFEGISPELAKRGFSGRDIGGIYGEVAKDTMSDVNMRTADLYKSAIGEQGATERQGAQIQSAQRIAGGQRASESANRVTRSQNLKKEREFRAIENQKERDFEQQLANQTREQAKSDRWFDIASMGVSMLLGPTVAKAGLTVGRAIFGDIGDDDDESYNTEEKNEDTYYGYNDIYTT